MIKRLKTERILLLCMVIVCLIALTISGLLEEKIYAENKRLKNENWLLTLENRSLDRRNEDYFVENDILLRRISEYEQKKTSLGEFEITYYCPCYECCGKTDGITASGTIAQEGITVAADWDILPVGTKIYIEDIGFRTVEDKGGVIKDNKLDVFMNSHSAALEAGRHKAKVWIVEVKNEKSNNTRAE